MTESLRRPWWRRKRWWFAIALWLIVAYPLSIGPAIWLIDPYGGSVAYRTAFETFYTPLEWVAVRPDRTSRTGFGWLESYVGFFRDR